MTFCKVGLQPAQYEEDTIGPTIDWGAGNVGFAVQSVGGIVSGTTVAGKIQHSTDGVTWFDMLGAVFATVQDSDRMQVIPIMTLAKYVRWHATVTAPGGWAFASGLFVQP